MKKRVVEALQALNPEAVLPAQMDFFDVLKQLGFSHDALPDLRAVAITMFAAVFHPGPPDGRPSQKVRDERERFLLAYARAAQELGEDYDGRDGLVFRRLGRLRIRFARRYPDLIQDCVDNNCREIRRVADSLEESQPELATVLWARIKASEKRRRNGWGRSKPKLLLSASNR